MEKETTTPTDQTRHRFWQAHIAAWLESGLSQSEYCRQRQLSRDTFIYWKKRLPPALNSPAGGIVPVPFRLPFPSSARPTAPLGLTMGNRFRVEIAADFDPALLEKLLLTLDRLS